MAAELADIADVKNKFNININNQNVNDNSAEINDSIRMYNYGLNNFRDLSDYDFFINLSNNETVIICFGNTCSFYIIDPDGYNVNECYIYVMADILPYFSYNDLICACSIF